ncbi:MAG: nitroreductase family protein [Candidatus Gastranaerophilaceae bacterium]|jgi:nitroreductase
MPLDLIRKRCSVRSFNQTKEISDHTLGCILEAARLAPSWTNVQPWHFIVIKDKTIKKLLSKLSLGQPHVAQAPVVIACCVDLNCFEYENFKQTLESRPGISQDRVNFILNSPTINPGLSGKDAIKTRVLEELTYAIAYMTIEAEDHNVSTCIIGAIGNEYTNTNLDTYAVVKEELGIPNNVYLATLLLLGYVSSDFSELPKQRKNFEDIVSYERFGKKMP